jgi:phosphatidylglycerophosphatase A
MSEALPRRLAAGFGLGHAPRAAGTAASLAALLAGWAQFALFPPLLLVSPLLAVLLGFWALARLPEAEADPSWVVIDEIAGQWLALAPFVFVPHRAGPVGWGVAFVLFRLFDIAKPWPVRIFDRRHDSVGVMGDDLCAGALAALGLTAWLVWRGG